MFRTAYRLPFRLLGIPVHLDITFLLILPVLAWVIGRNVEVYLEFFDLPIESERLQEGATPFLVGLVAAVGLFLSVLIHELGHSVVAKGYGVKVKRIVLWILGGMAQFESIPHRSGVEAMIAIAGPATSFALVLLFHVAQTALPSQAAIPQFVLTYLLYMNVALASFNLLPALPLDGGRVLRSLLALKVPYFQATRICAGTSKALALLMGLVGFLFYNIFLMLIAFFVYIAATGESQAANVSEVLKGMTVEDLMTRKVKTVRSDSQAVDLLGKMLRERHLGYPVVTGSGELVGVIALEDIQQLDSSSEDCSTTVDRMMSTKVSTISEKASAWEAFRWMSQNSFRRLMVVDPQGMLKGIITKTDLIRAIQVRTVDFSLENLPPS